MSRIANSNVAGYMQGVGQALTDDTTYHISSSATTVLGATAEVAEVIASEEQRQKDFKVISDSFETIMKFLENVAGNVAVVKTHNNEKIIEMNTNFSIVPQLKHQVDQLTKQLSEGTDAQSKPKPKPKFIQPNELKNARHYTNCTQDTYLTILANLRNSPYILNFLGLTKLHDKWLPKITNFEYSRGLDAYTIDLENSVLTMVHWFPPEKMLHYQLNQDVWKPDPDSRPDIVDLFNSLYDLLDKVKPDCSPLFSPIKNDEAIKASISINNNNKANNIVNGGNDDGDDPSLLPNFVDFSLDDLK
ncbi:11026_t:CDS:2 [Entrophospora sp. SA101]|nr:11026_t:CDS:2 [Entrophospora sp. SA101]